MGLMLRGRLCAIYFVDGQCGYKGWQTQRKTHEGLCHSFKCWNDLKMPRLFYIKEGLTVERLHFRYAFLHVGMPALRTLSIDSLHTQSLRIVPGAGVWLSGTSLEQHVQDPLSVK